jgi:hypothetical protein
MEAPIARSGSATRSIGLRDRLGSPVSTVRNPVVASNPMSNRIEVPEFPHAKGPDGSVIARRPSPSTSSGVEGGRSSSPSTLTFHVER